MTADEKLAAILAAVQTDPANRGLARDPYDNLFTATVGDFAAACHSLAESAPPRLTVVTGFPIVSPERIAHETDGPLGALFLARAAVALGGVATYVTENMGRAAFRAGWKAAGRPAHITYFTTLDAVNAASATTRSAVSHVIAVERVGPSTTGDCFSMSRRNVTEYIHPAHRLFEPRAGGPVTIGVGDGGNEMGMGKVTQDTVAKNIPHGDIIHCRVPADYLIVAGVSNWGAYALAAGLFVVRGVRPPADLFDPAFEQSILHAMVIQGQLVDGVTGQPSVTVDGLTWEEYARPLVRMQEVLSW